MQRETFYVQPVAYRRCGASRDLSKRIRGTVLQTGNLFDTSRRKVTLNPLTLTDYAVCDYWSYRTCGIAAVS